MRSSADITVTLRIELLGIEPLIWRRVRVTPALSLQALHRILQIVMGWEDAHWHDYRIGEVFVGSLAHVAPEVRAGLEDERLWTVAQVVASGELEFEYVYDLADDWRHRIVLEPASRCRLPGTGLICLAGERACPPESVGGPQGYLQMLEAVDDPSHPAHQECLARVGGIWDPSGFDLNRVNRELREQFTSQPLQQVG